MDQKDRRKHLHTSVRAATAYGMITGLWIGLRMSHAGWIEAAAFAAFILFAPSVTMSRIDAKYKYED